MSARAPQPAIPIRRLRELLEVRRLGRQPASGEGLVVRTAYGNLFATLGGRYGRDKLRRIARQSRRVLRRTQLELLDPTPWPGFAFSGLEHLERALSRAKGAFVVSFHVGPYRFIPIELSQLGQRVSIVVDQRGAQRETAIIEKHAALLAKTPLDAQGRAGYWRADVLERLGVINAEEPDVALRIVKALRDGRVVMVYLDGNTGSGPRRTEHAVRAPFLGTHILVRPGIGELATLTGATVVPVLSRRRLRARHTCHFHAPIVPGPEESRADFSTRVLRETVALLEQRLERRPGEWEEWHHFHRMQETAAAGGTTPAGEPAEAVPGPRFVVDDYRAFAVSDGAMHLVFEPERRRYVKVTDLGARLVRAMSRPRSAAELADLFGASYGRQAVIEELDRLASRNWLEQRP